MGNPITGEEPTRPVVEEAIAEWFEKNQWTWNLADGGHLIPDAADVEAALDEAARLLYTEPVDTQLSVGRLHIVRTESGHDVFMYVGSYE
jgi:hypothetical protein